MSFDWFSAFIGWVGGIPSGLLANWLFHKYIVWRKSRGEYIATTVSNEAIEFEGRVWHNSQMKAKIINIVQTALGFKVERKKK